MKNIKSIFSLSLIAAVVLSLITFSNVFQVSAENNTYLENSNADYSAVAVSLSNKLKTDLAINDLSVRLKNVEESEITTQEIVVKGEAICILPNENTQLPLQFEAKLKKANNSFEDVKYVFVEENYAPSTNEEVLMKELMKQISTDYKTEQITIAIDDFESTTLNDNQRSVKGLGEVRVGDLVWSKITFDVVINKNNQASKIDYNIEKH